MPPEFRQQMNMKIYDDMEYLLRYIKALHLILEDSVPKDKIQKNQKASNAKLTYLVKLGAQRQGNVKTI